MLVAEDSDKVVDVFNADYVSDADVQFLEYLEKCYDSYFGSYYNTAYPYMTLVQSAARARAIC